MSNSLWPHELQHTRLPCPSLSPGVFSIHVHCVNDAIQPSHPLLPPSSSLNLSQHLGLFQSVGFFFYQVAKVLELWLQHQSFQWIFSWFLKSFLQHHNFLVGFHAVRSLEVGSLLGHLYHVLRFSCLLSHSHTMDPSAPAFCLYSEEDKGPRAKCVHLLCLNSCLWALPSPFHSWASSLSHGSQRWEMECINQAWALIEGEKGSWLHNCPRPTGFLYFLCLMVSWLV